MDYALNALKADTVNWKYCRKYKSTFANPLMHLYRYQNECPVALRIVFSQTNQSVTIQISDDEHIHTTPSQARGLTLEEKNSIKQIFEQKITKPNQTIFK